MDSGDLKLIAVFAAIGFIGKQLWKFIQKSRLNEDINEAIFTRDNNMRFRSRIFNSMHFRPDTAMRPAEIMANLFGLSTRSIDVAVYHFSVKMLTEALIEAKNRGVNVRVIVDSSSYGLGAVNDHIDRMRNAGVPVRIYHDNIMMHIKMSLIDVTEEGLLGFLPDFRASNLPANGLTVTGSMNWSRDAVTKNQEMIIVTSNKNICQESKRNFENLWANSEGARI